MEIRRAYKFQLEPDKNQALLLEQYARVCNVVYNLALEQRNLAREPDHPPSLVELRKAFELRKEKADARSMNQGFEVLAGNKKTVKWRICYSSKKDGYISQNHQLTKLRGEFDWVEKVPCSVEQETLRQLHAAFKNFFDRVRKGQIKSQGKNPYGYPVFRKKSKVSLPWKPNDIRIKSLSRKVDPESKDFYSTIRIPKIPGVVLMRQNRTIPGKIGGPIITKTNDKWFISFPCMYEITDPAPKEGIIGIDLGVKYFAAFDLDIDFRRVPAGLIFKKDGGTLIKLPSSLEKLQQKISRLQTCIDKKKQGPNIFGSGKKRKPSKNWLKAKKKITGLHAKQKNIRANLQHQISKDLADHFGIVKMEKLDIVKMTETASGSEEFPGKNVKQKAWLNREILNQAWGHFKFKVDYKLACAGGALVDVDPKNTSRKCSVCGFTLKENRNGSRFLCKNCKFETDADINAARNIAAA